jgi:hypothetical protein
MALRLDTDNTLSYGEKNGLMGTGKSSLRILGAAIDGRL